MWPGTSPPPFLAEQTECIDKGLVGTLEGLHVCFTVFTIGVPPKIYTTDERSPTHLAFGTGISIHVYTVQRSPHIISPYGSM